MFFDSESPTLKTAKNYTIIMTNNIDKIRILQVLLIFELIQQAALLNFLLFSDILKILKISFETF